MNEPEIFARLDDLVKRLDRIEKAHLPHLTNLPSSNC